LPPAGCEGGANFALQRAWHERAAQWRDAYDKHGTGSTVERSRFIGDETHEPAAPPIAAALHE